MNCPSFADQRSQLMAAGFPCDRGSYGIFVNREAILFGDLAGMFSATISALCYSIVDELETPSGRIDYTRRNKVVRFALEQHARMPDFLRAPVTVATVLFSLHGFLKTGVPYHRHSPALRRVHLLSWKVSRFGFKRDFVRLFESLATFAWFSYAG